MVRDINVYEMEINLNKWIYEYRYRYGYRYENGYNYEHVYQYDHGYVNG